MTHPYTQLPPSSFWKTGLQWQDGNVSYPDLWRPRFPISPQTRILTAGSCFAQHISRWLIANGYTWVDTEPAGDDLPQEARQDGQYGVFSFRTGNIYTAALLRQWLELALTSRAPILDVAEEDGRFFDLLRPMLPANGLDSVQAVAAAQTETLTAIREGLGQADLFIFTLGLTESWRHRDGHVYPMCPGTVRGTFDPATTSFWNQSYHEVREDMAQAIALARSINPYLKILLTVSPVPLTATASDEHVVSATTYSKSVLRAVAGDLAHSMDGVDYFPSYELISAYPGRGRFFDTNMRTVTPDGVAHVMAQFSAGIGASSAEGVAKLEPARAASGVTRTDDRDADEILCDDVRLESWAPDASNAADASVCLIGDSHMGHLSTAFRALGIAHAGGMIMNGKAWTSNELHLDEEELWVPLENALARSRWRDTLPFLASPRTDTGGQKTVLTNIGQQTHRTVAFLSTWLQKEHNSKLTNDLFFQYFLQENREKMVLIKKFVNFGFRTIVVTDPPTQHLAGYQDTKLWAIYEKLSEKVYRELGCDVYNARDHITIIGFQDRFISEKFKAGNADDWLHGSPAYYEEIARQLVRQFALT